VKIVAATALALSTVILAAPADATTVSLMRLRSLPSTVHSGARVSVTVWDLHWQPAGDGTLRLTFYQDEKQRVVRRAWTGERVRVKTRPLWHAGRVVVSVYYSPATDDASDEDVATTSRTVVRVKRR
jgi:hypothetical protein